MTPGFVRYVTERAVLQRVNRRLARSGCRLSYGPDPWGQGKSYREIDASNTIKGAVRDLESYARDHLGVLASHERIAAA